MGSAVRICHITMLAAALCAAGSTAVDRASAQDLPAVDPAGEQDILVPLEPERRIMTLDAELIDLAEISSARPDAVEARIFQSADGSYTLEILFDREGQRIRERRPIEADAVAALQERLSRALGAVTVAEQRSRGRTGFLLGSSALSLGFYSWAVPKAFDLSDREGVAAGMLAAAVGFFAPMLATSYDDVTTGMAVMSLHGSTRGIVHGIALYEWLWDDDDDEVVVDEDNDDPQLQAALAASVVEGIGGYFWARQAHMNAGHAQTIGVAGDFGTLWGVGIAELLDADPEDETEVRGASVLAASAAGLAAGAFLAEDRGYSWGSAEVVRTAGLLGAGIAATGVDISDTENANPYVAAAMAASVAGVVAGDRLVVERNFSVGEALLIDAGTIAGGALGLGAAYLLSDDSSDSKPYTIAAAIGSTGAFALFYHLMQDEAHERGPAQER
jgi:hypothetical protein